jgi:hypothetical protein
MTSSFLIHDHQVYVWSASEVCFGTPFLLALYCSMHRYHKVVQHAQYADDTQLYIALEEASSLPVMNN